VTSFPVGKGHCREGLSSGRTLRVGEDDFVVGHEDLCPDDTVVSLDCVPLDCVLLDNVRLWVFP